MNFLSEIRRRLGLKIFLSYTIIILVGVTVLAAAAELTIPGAFDHHLASMGEMMASMMGEAQSGLEMDLFTSFRAAVSEALTLAALAAALSAGIVSLFVSRQVVAPVQEMMKATQRIAEGHYEERVHVPGNISREEQDELGRLALRFNQMADRLEKTETLRRQLIADVAHELRTPLTVLQGSIEGLLDGVLPAKGETLQPMYNEVARMRRLVDDLQELSRVEAGAYALNLRPVPVEKLVEDTVARLGHQYGEKGVDLVIELDADLPNVLADQDRIEQVLLNLVGNALQYTPAGSKVWIRACHQGNEVRVSVTDTGIGIPAEHLPHLFTRFYRVDRSRSRAGGGSGIGLTIAKFLVEAHEGRIEAHSAGPGQGSTFTFTLPTAPPNSL
jgi:histidine kinase